MPSVNQPPGMPWVDWQRQKQAKANGQPEPPKSTQSSRAGHTGAERNHHARSVDDCEEWAKTTLDDEIDLVEADPEGERNDRLNKRALRCFRVAMGGDFDLDDVFDALFDAARVAGARGNPHTDTEIRATLRSARGKALKDGPAYPDDHITEVDEL